MSKPGYTPSGFRTANPRYNPSNRAESSLPCPVIDSYDRTEQPMDDESYLLVPIFKGGQDDEERLARLLYSDEPYKRYGSEVRHGYHISVLLHSASPL